MDFDAVTIMKNAHGVELNLITNGVGSIGGKNIVMDVPEKYPRYTHVALRVDSILQCLAELQRHEISVRVARAPRPAKLSACGQRWRRAKKSPRPSLFTRAKSCM